MYRDAAFVRHRRRATLALGRNDVVFDVATTVVAGTAQLAVVGGGHASVIEARHLLALPDGEEVLRGWIGREVAADDVRGTLRAVSASELVVEVDGALRVLSRPIEVRGPTGAPHGAALRWTVSTRAAGERAFEATYVVGGLAWNAGYTLVLESGDRRSAWLEGWLSVDNRTGAELAASRALLIDQPFTAPAPPVESQPGRRIALRAPLRVAHGRRVELPLLAGGARRVPAALTAVFDPVGYRLDLRRREPIAGETYGAVPPGWLPLATHVEVDLRAARVAAAALPPGECLVLERSGAGMIPLGRARAFDRHNAGGAARLRLAIGGAADLVGRRRQTEYARDPDARRLVEEIRVDVENRRATAAEVLIREHLYRGLNWSLAYANEVARVAKEGAQEITFRLVVPPRSTREVVYRVVYTW